MEETVLTPASTLADVEQQLSALAQRLSAQIEAFAQQEQARSDALSGREEDLCRREMAAQARDALQERGLPTALADCLCFADAEEMQNGVDALEKAFRAAVQQGVEDRLLSDAPKSAAMKPLSEMTDEEYYAAVAPRD